MNRELGMKRTLPQGEDNNKKLRFENEDESDTDTKNEHLKVPKTEMLTFIETTETLDKGTKENLLANTVKRILNSGKNGAPRQKILTTIASTFNEEIRDHILTFLVSDLRTHLDLALAWLFEEYSIMQGFTRLPEIRRNTRPDQSYNTLLTSLVSSSSSDEGVLSRLLLEAPVVTEQVLDQLCMICRDEQSYSWSMGLLKDLIFRRPTLHLMFLTALLDHTTHESKIIKDCAIAHMNDLYMREDLKKSIEDFVIKNLEYLKHPMPPKKLFGQFQGRLNGVVDWTDDLARACLQPYMSLLTLNEQLIHNLAKVYVHANANIKRMILRLLEGPVRTMSMDSLELLKFVEECPEGSETLVASVVHVLTDKGPPSRQLVQRVCALYRSRSSDIRFLIPVLNGLSRKEVTAVLPKLIKLNPEVVRKVLDRLLGAHGGSCISPTDLLVTLHLLIDQSRADLKTVMKATSICLSEKHVFTQEVLALVMQRLMEQPVLPTLLMRTVMQALGTYPRLSGLVMNILQRLVLKKVWKHKLVWEGFVKCCQRIGPQSFPILMQLPPAQFLEALVMCPELKQSLRDHLLLFSENQRSDIPEAVQEILIGKLLRPTEVQVPAMPIVSRPLVELLPPGTE